LESPLAFWWPDMNIYLVLSAFILGGPPYSRLIKIVFFFVIGPLYHTDQKMMCLSQFRSILAFLDLPNGVF
jgi:hypothetical protein